MIAMKKGFKYLLRTVLAAIVIYNSLYFRPLNEKLAEEKEVVFDAKAFVDGIWQNALMVYDSSILITTLLDQLKKNPQLTFEQHAQALGIGNIAYFKVNGDGVVQRVNENNILLKIDELSVEIETEFIFGNAVRDASGLIRINDFDETSDFNLISEAINDKIREEVIPNFRSNVKEGDRVFFKGSLELNKAHLNLDQLKVIPISLQITR